MLLAERIIPTGIMARSKMTVHPSREFQEKAIALIIHSLAIRISIVLIQGFAIVGCRAGFTISLSTQLILFSLTTASLHCSIRMLSPNFCRHILPQPTIS